MPCSCPGVRHPCRWRLAATLFGAHRDGGFLGTSETTYRSKWPVHQSKSALTATGVVLLVAVLALVLLVATSPPTFVYDEADYASNVPLLHQYGFTLHFMNSMIGAAGPLYAFVHFVFEPLTALHPVRMRFANLLLFAALAGILVACLKRQNWPDHPWLSAGSVLVVPMAWVLGGLALTEMPAVVFVALSLYLQLRGLEALEQGRPVTGWFAASAVCLGIAVWGRQPYLLLSGVPVLLALLDRRLRVPAVVFVAVVLAAAITLFVIWKGLVPPSNQAAQQRGLALTNGFISLAYAGICFLLLAPRTRWLPTTTSIGLVVATVGANAWLGLVVLYPIRSVADRYLSAALMPAYGILCGSALLSVGVVFLVWFLRVSWQGRNDLRQVTINAGLWCVVLTPAFIGHQYSSRYTAMALPYLVLASHPWREWRWKTAATAATGCGLGFVSLFSYLFLQQA